MSTWPVPGGRGLGSVSLPDHAGGAVITRIAVIGGGIKGASLSALLDHDPSVSCDVLEAGAALLGGSFANHGRLHAGTAGWNRDSVPLMRRRHQGSVLLRSLGIGAHAAPARYNFTDVATADAFVAKADLAGIPVRPARYDAASDWFSEPGVGFDVCEYAFEPAQVATNLLDGLHAGTASWSSRVDRVERAAAGFELSTATSRTTADVVVNCAARWSQDVELSWRTEPLFELDDFEWAVLAARAGDLPPLDRIVVDQADGDNASIVPHGDWVTFDYKSPATQVDHHVEPRVDISEIDRDDAIFSVCVASFPRLKALQHVSSFRGVQARLRHAPPGSVNQLFEDPDAMGYLAAQGGQASTALLDAFEIVLHLWRRGFVAADPADLLSGLLRRHADVTRAPVGRTVEMAWELCV